MSAIVVSGLGKAYKIYPSRWGRLAEWSIPGSKRRHELKWVLQDISFTVNPGEAVGIIGINGAGKSTLLKMITGTTQPTAGSVSIKGRVAAMLELGMGFHADFTGRQNAYMAGQLLGYSAEDITELMPEIESFSGIGDYMDQPVRVYSSGMQMRLAFSVATAHRPDVLIVDEALSVGDAYFQHKSFDRIREFRRQGTTLLIVSHDKQAIQSICDKAILLNAGSVAMQGDPETVMDYYNVLLAEQKNSVVRRSASEAGKTRLESGTFEAEIVRVELLNKQGIPVEVLSVGEEVRVAIAVSIHSDVEGVVLGFGVKDRFGQMMFGTNTFHTGQRLESANAGDVIQFDIHFDANLGVGSYSIHCSLTSNDSHVEKNYHWIDRALVFDVVNLDKPHFAGCSWNPVRFDVKTNNVKY